MKAVFLLCAVAVTMAMVQGQGVPTKKCPPSEHSVLYCPQKAEPDCVDRTVHNLNPGNGLCGVPQCFCNTPTVRNTKTGKCVNIADC